MEANQHDTDLAFYRISGIVLGVGPTGPRAPIQGSGIDVFEVVRTCLRVGCDVARVAEAYHWLTTKQLRAALAYYKQYPDEIDRRLSEEDAVTPESLQAAFRTAHASRKMSY